MDDLAGVFDGAWAGLEQRKLEAYTGATQRGGKYDAVLMTLGIVIAMQMRRNMNLPTLLEKCDLLFGFDLAWRDGTRLHIGRAGVRGRMWLVADAAMDEDRFRVRLGPLVGALAVLRGVGIGQGRRSAVHQFGALVKALTDAVVGCTLGVGLGVPPAATRAWQRCDAGSGGVWGEVCWNTVREAALGAGGGTEDEWHVAMGGLRKGAERLVPLDTSAKARFLVLQFVDWFHRSVFCVWAKGGESRFDKVLRGMGAPV